MSGEKKLQGTQLALVNVTKASDVLMVESLERECCVRKPLHVVPLFEKLGDLGGALATLFSINCHRNRTDGKEELVIGYLSDHRKDADRLSAVWQLMKSQEDLIEVANLFGIKMIMFLRRGDTREREGTPTHLAILMTPETIHGSSLRVTVQWQVLEQSFGEEQLCFRTLQEFTVASSLEYRLHPPKPEWPKLMDEMAIVATNEYS